MKPTDFIYERKDDKHHLEKYETDLDLIAKVQSGKGDATFVFYGKRNLFVEKIFAGTIPAEVEQDYDTGKNDLYAAKMA